MGQTIPGRGLLASDRASLGDGPDLAWSRTSFGHRLLLTAVLLGMLLLASGCACGNARTRFGLGGRPTATPTPPPPTATPTPAPTPTPTATLLVPTPPQEGNGVAGIPTERDTPFTVELTQQQINEYLAGREFNQSGVAIRDLQVTVTEDALIADFRATQAESGLSGGVTVRGVPRAVDGQLYFQVDDLTLDDSIRGLARMLARAAIDQALRRYATDDGIPVPIENVEVHEIELERGVIIVTGRTR